MAYDRNVDYTDEQLKEFAKRESEKSSRLACSFADKETKGILLTLADENGILSGMIYERNKLRALNIANISNFTELKDYYPTIFHSSRDTFAWEHSELGMTYFMEYHLNEKIIDKIITKFAEIMTTYGYTCHILDEKDINDTNREEIKYHYAKFNIYFIKEDKRTLRVRCNRDIVKKIYAEGLFDTEHCMSINPKI
jgi:hypothetical protein